MGLSSWGCCGGGGSGDCGPCSTCTVTVPGIPTNLTLGDLTGATVADFVKAAAADGVTVITETSCPEPLPAPANDCDTIITLYRCASTTAPTVITVNGTDYPLTCVNGVELPEPCPDFGVQWSPGVTGCQQLKITPLTAISPVTVTVDGVPLAAPYELDGLTNTTPVDIVVTDGNGCAVTEQHTNSLDISEDMWIEPAAITANTNATAGVTLAVPGTSPGTPSTHVTIQGTTNPAGAELTQALTNEIVRMRRGTPAEPNRIFLDNGTGVPIPIPNLPCSPDVEWGVRIRDIGTLEAGDGVQGFLDFYDAAGTLISSAPTFGPLVDDYGNLTPSGTITPPAGAVGVIHRIEGWTNANNEWHYLYLSTDDTYLRAA